MRFKYCYFLKLNDITYDNFTLSQYFAQRPLSRKHMDFSINYIVSVPPFWICLYWCVTSCWHERNATTPHRFSRKSGKYTCFMLTLTRHEVNHAHKYLNTNNYLYSHTLLHDNTNSEPGNKSPHLLSIYSLHAQRNKGEHKKIVQTYL